VASPTGVAAASAAGAKAQSWFASLKSSAGKSAAGKGSTASRTAEEAQPTINWERAIYAGEYVIAPFVETANPFVDGHHYGYRFLVVRTDTDSCTGRIAELLTGQPAEPEQAARLALAGTQPLLAGRPPGPVADFTGALLVYSPAYEYETGLAYTAGALQPLRMSVYTAVPGIPPPDTCYDYFLVGYDNTGTQVVHDYLFSSCSGGIPGLGTSWGGGGGSPTTGGGGGGAANPNQPKMPCAALTRDGQNAQVQAQLTNLKGLLTDNKEHGVATYYGATGTPTFTTATGTPGQLGIFSWSIAAGVASVAHTHYNDPNSLSVFSEGDLQALWVLYQSGNMANPSTFTSTIITASGTVYALAITNQAAFTNFGNNNGLSSSITALTTALNGYNISFTNSVADNEHQFVQMLGQLNMGLTLYKGDPNNFASWQKLSYTNGTATPSPCN